MKHSYLILSLLFIFLCSSCDQEPEEVIYDEALVPAYKLPEVLLAKNGKTIDSIADWIDYRREEILQMFKNEVYGDYPDKDYSISFSPRILNDTFLNGRAVMKEILCTVSTDQGQKDFSILYVYPSFKKEVPVFAALNFIGNHTIDSFPGITVHDSWVENRKSADVSENRVNAASRGIRASRWPIKTIIDKGFGLATAYYGEIDPDYDDGFLNGFHPLFAEKVEVRNMQSPGSISMWAKGMSFIADYLLQDTIADPTSIIALGHSRLGKTALWAGANDQRFAAVISNNSGCGGAALSKRRFGERVGRINKVFPHWFCERFKRYNEKENKLPLDQHMLLALMAPRPVYVASATEDQWADPNGEFLALKAAVPVYELAGYSQEFPEQIPPANNPYHGITGYHLRSGVHDLIEYDWVLYMDWCQKWLSH